MASRKPNATAAQADQGGLARVAVCGAVRTPFVKSFGVFENETALSLSLRVATEVIARTGVNPEHIEEVVWGAVIPQTRNPNVARDIVLFAGLPASTPGYTLNKACASSLQSVLSAADAIRLGRTQVALAGGVEVLSDVPITYSDEAQRFLTRMSRTRTFKEKVGLLKDFNPKAFLPRPPALAEPFTGLTMGEHGEVMAVKNDISRERQDAYALMSHKRAFDAMARGEMKPEIVPVWTGRDKSMFVDTDNIVRGDTTLESLAKIKPAFDKRNGTITAGNASALTDGASAVLLASEAYAKTNGLPILGYVVDGLTVAVDPRDQLLIGPAIAVPKLLARHGLSMDDVGVFEIHEAFAAQVLSCLDAMADETFCRQKAGLDAAFGRIPFEKLNLDGSSLAYGHPFGATGGRLIGRALRIAQKKKSRYAAIGVCAAGGMGQAMLLETT
jgi:acetyl-CoA acetyltransferase family protein